MFSSITKDLYSHLAQCCAHIFGYEIGFIGLIKNNACLCQGSYGFNGGTIKLQKNYLLHSDMIQIWDTTDERFNGITERFPNAESLCFIIVQLNENTRMALGAISITSTPPIAPHQKKALHALGKLSASHHNSLNIFKPKMTNAPLLLH